MILCVDLTPFRKVRASVVVLQSNWCQKVFEISSWKPTYNFHDFNIELTRWRHTTQVNYEIRKVDLAHMILLLWGGQLVFQYYEFTISLRAIHFFPMANNKRNILSHPVVNAELSKLRQSSTSSKEFREVCDLVWWDCNSTNADTW